MNLTHILGWTLLHFMWQGTLIAVLLAVALAVLRQSGSLIRYGVSCAALLLMLICAGATFLNLKVASESAYPIARALSNVNPSVGVSAIDRAATGTLGDYLPAIVWAWFGGVIALSIRSFGGWVVAERFAKRHTWRAEETWEQKFAELTKRLSISKPVRLAVSALAEVPAVVGWLRPVVLVPASVFVGLNAEQIEALLVHELAHIRRHDYLVNLLQTAVETLLFYHPAVWWVSRQVRQEREHCCDDIAVEICGDTLAYVRALTELEELRSEPILRNAAGLAMAADGGSLLCRVQRLLRMGQRTHMGLHSWLAIVGIAAGLSVVGIAVNAWAQQSNTTATPQVAPEERESSTWLDGIEAEGYRGLNVDQLIRLKEQGVDGAYIRKLRAAGLKLAADELVRFHEHGIENDFIDELKQVGLVDLKADELIRLSEHGVHAKWIREIQSIGYDNITTDDIIRFQEHGVTVESIKALKQAGLADLTADDVIRLSEHDIDPTSIRQLQSLGYRNIRADDLVRLNEQGVTPEFIREAQQRFKDVSIDQLIRLREFGILDKP